MRTFIDIINETSPELEQKLLAVADNLNFDIGRVPEGAKVIKIVATVEINNREFFIRAEYD